MPEQIEPKPKANPKISPKPVDTQTADSRGWGPLVAIFGSVAALLFSQVVATVVANYRYGGIDNVLNGGVEPWTFLGFEAGIALMMIGVVLLIVRTTSSPLRELGFKKTPFLQAVYSTLTILIVYILAAIVVFNVLELFISESALNADQDLGYSDDVVNKANLLPIFIGLVFVASVSEEILFRGFIFTGFRKLFSFWPAAIASSLLFALAHQQFNVGVDVFLMALGAAWLLEKTNSLYPAIALHMLKNTIAFALVYVASVG